MATMVTSEEINYLIYRYLQESGFQHTAFTFGMEANIAKSNVNVANVPPGALISFLQKGLQFLELEQHVEANGDHIQYAEPISLLNTAPPRTVVKREPSLGARNAAEVGGGGGARASMDVDGDEGNGSCARVRGASVSGGGGGGGGGGAGGGAGGTVSIRDSEVTHLHGHESEVFICAWSPTELLLASGSGDATARIWSLPLGPCGSEQSAALAKPAVLRHNTSGPGKDVTTLDWSPDGTCLATGSYDGRARIWSARGELRYTLGGGAAAGGGVTGHEGPIFALKWNKNSSLLLSGSVDKTAIVWDAATGQLREHYRLHRAPTLDVDWRDDTSFATCSTDKQIHVCRLGEPGAVRTFSGHTDEVNCIKWDASGRLLASCSDDCTARIWSMDSDKPVHTLSDHGKEIYTLKWAPPQNARGVQLLASASLDKTIKLWDVTSGACLATLAHHTEPVYSVAFSPSGQHIASGSPDKHVLVWSVKDGTLLKTFKGPGGIYEVCWNKAGTKLAASFSTNALVVMDMRF